MKIHVAGYTRQSAARANKSEASPAAQRAANRLKFDQLTDDAVWCGHYEDIGVSAFSGKERPGFNRLLRDCHAGRVNMIIVHHISRLSRLEPADALPIVNDLLSLGVTIISTTEGVFRKGNVMELNHLIIRLDSAYQESRNKGNFVRAAADAARVLGGYVGGHAPFGRRLEQEIRLNNEGKPIAVQVLVSEPDEVKVIREIWETIKEHKSPDTDSDIRGGKSPGSLGAITTELNRRRIPTSGARRNKKTSASVWHQSTLTAMLRHPHLAGFAADPVYRPQKKDPGKKQVTGYAVRLDAAGDPVQAWEPIIGPTEWYDLQAWLDSRPERKPGPRAGSLLTSMNFLYCECGRPMGGRNNQRPVGGTYACSRQRGAEAAGEHQGGSSIGRAALDEYVARKIFTRLSEAMHDPEPSHLLATARERFAFSAEDGKITRARQDAVRMRAEAARALEMLYGTQGSYRNNAIGREYWIRDVATQEDRMQAAETRIAELSAHEIPELPVHSWLHRSTGWDGDPVGTGSWWASATLEERRTLVNCFLDRVVIRKAAPHEKSRGNKAGPVVGPRTTLVWASATPPT